MAFYNQRGKAEQYIKEGKNAIKWTRSVVSQVPRQCRSAAASRPGLQSRQLHADAGFAEGGGALVMTTLREKLVKIGAKVVRHGRYVTFQLAEVAVPKELFRKILSLIDDLRRRPAPA